VYASGADGLVHAFRPCNGKLLWSFDPPGGIPVKVAVANGTLYFANDEQLFAMRLPARGSTRAGTMTP